MKASNTGAAAAVISQRVSSRVFREALRKACTPPTSAQPHTGLSSLQDAARAHHKWEETLQTARVDVNDTAQRIETARYDNELVDLVCRELRIAFEEEPLLGGDPAPERPEEVPFFTPSAEVTRVGFSIGTAAKPLTRASAALALVSRIEVFLRGMLPRISLTLNNALGATVDIERMGPKAVAVRIKGPHGPPKPEEVNRLREELGNRGLKLLALSVG
jgi:hypothetical protein